jgi:hypothetical protein
MLTQQPPPLAPTAMMPGPYITQGGLPIVPSASITLPAFACTGVLYSAGVSTAVTQVPAIVGPLVGGNGTYWVALHRDPVAAVSGWTRQAGTRYLWTKATTRPALADGVVLALVTVAGGVITQIDDLRVPSSLVREGTYNVTDPLYGGVADDSTDVGPALRAAIAAAIAQRGRVVRLPQGVYALASGIEIPAGVAVRGDGWAPTEQMTSGLTTLPRRGTWLHISAATFEPFSIVGSGTALRDLAFDHDQPVGAPGWAPTIYPYAVTIRAPAGPWFNGDIELNNLLFFKTSHGINQQSVGGQSSARVNMRGIWGQLFTVGIRLEFLADVSRISDVHFWPYWSTESHVMDYQFFNMIGLALLRTDSLMLHNIFVYGANIGLHFFDNSFGPTAGLQATNLAFDVVRLGVYGNQVGTTGLVTNLRTFGSWNGTTVSPNFETATGIVIDKGSVILAVSNFEAGSLGGSAARVQASTSVLLLSNVYCNNFNLGGGGAAALQATAGSLLVGGTQVITTPHGAPSYSGTFLPSLLPALELYDASNGATPAKFLRVRTGSLEVLDAAEVAVLHRLSNTGTPSWPARRGQVQISESATSATVTLTPAEPDTAYFVQLTVILATGTAGSCTVTGVTKATGTFTVAVQAAPGTGKTVIYDWFVYR